MLQPCREINNMSKIRLAVVETPLQLLCAYEALEDNRGDYIILRLTGAVRNDKQILTLARELNLCCITVKVPPRKPLAMLRAVWTLRHLLLRNYEVVYLGSYFSRFIRSIALFFRGPVFILDDGVATLLAQTKMQNSRKYNSIYTFLPVNPLPGQTCVRHSFKRLAARFRSPKKTCLGTYFIGQPLVEKGLISEILYHSLLRDCVKTADGAMIYLAHRAESDYSLKKIGGIPGIVVQQVDLPVELYFLMEVPPPKVIFSCISTALFSLSLLLPDSRIEAKPLRSLYNNSRVPHAVEIISAMKASARIYVTEH